MFRPSSDVKPVAVDDPTKRPTVEITEVAAESSGEGSESGSHQERLHEAPANSSPEVDDDSVADSDTTQRRISQYSQNSEGVFDEPETKHNPKSSADLTIDTVLDGEVPLRQRLGPRRAVSSGLLSDGEDLDAFDQSFTTSDDGLPPGAIAQTMVNKPLPKRRTRDSLGGHSHVRRTFSSESTTTNFGRRASNLPKNLPIEERIVKAHACIKELQNVCYLPATRERVTIQHVFDLIDRIRMRQVPHQWSLVDRRLKQIQSSAECIEEFISLVKDHGSDADAVASMFYACCELALQGKIFDSTALDSLLAVFHRTTVILQHVKTSVPQGASSEQLYATFSKIIQVQQRICINFVDMLNELRSEGFGSSTSFGYQINKYFEFDISSLTLAAHAACQELWVISLRNDSDTSLGPCHGRILAWLNDHNHGKVSFGFSRGRVCGHGHSFVFDCVEPIVMKFFKTSSRFLLVTGEAGFGEQEMVSNLMERLQLALPVDAKLLRASFGSSTKTSSSAIRFVKSLLNQLLDQCVGHTSFLSALNRVMGQCENETPARQEDLLWELLIEQCSKVGGNVAIIVDGISDNDGTSTSAQHLLVKLQELTSKCGTIRCLALADPSAATIISGVQIYTLSRGDIRRNARLFLQGAISASTTLSVLSVQLRRELLRHVTERQWTSLLEAKLILRLLECEHDLARMPDIICKTPKTVHGILDHMILKIDFKNQEIQTLISWLLVSKRSIEVSEFERAGSVTISNWLRRIRSGRSVSSNSFLAGIITVQDGYVRFVDSTVRARMHHMCLHGKIPLSLHNLHRQVAIDCLKHCREYFSKQKTELVFQDPAKSKWASITSYNDFDAFLTYSVKNWYEHYEKSLTSSEKLSRHIPAEISSKLPDSILMALAEWHYSRADIPDIGLDNNLSKILTLRKAVFGAKAPSVIQTMINLAHSERSIRSLTIKINLERLVEAFEGTILAYGDPSPQATAGAKYIVSLIKSQHSIPSKGFKVYKYLWSVNRRELGDSHDETLRIAQKLAELYKAEMRFTEAAEILHAMYEACCRTKGLFAIKTIDIFHLLIDALEHSDNMTDAERLCQDVFDAAPKLETWNEVVLLAVCRIVRHYEDRGMAEVSKSKLKQLWTLLQGHFKKDTGKNDLLVAFTFVTLQLATKMRDLSLEKEATSTLKAYWVIAKKYITTDRRCELKTLTQLREISQLLLRLEQHQEALSILRVLYEIHQLPSHDHFEEMVQVYSALIICYKQVKNPIEDFLWVNILDSILVTASGHGCVGSDTVFLCRDLAVLHRSRSQWSTAISICRKSLHVLWPQILLLKEGGSLSLPKAHARECVQMAVIMAQMYRMTKDHTQSENLLQFIIGSCKKHVLLWHSSSQEIATILSLTLEEADLSLEAHKFWKSILVECRTHLGHSHHFTLYAAAAIVRLNLKLDLTIEDDEFVCGFFDVEPDEDDLESISVLIEGLFALCKGHAHRKKKESGAVVLKWYERLWTYYFDLRHDLAMDTSRGFEIFQGYSAILISMNSISMAVRLARKLRATFLSDFGRQDIWYLKASLELTRLLEMDDTTMREAVDIYDEINEIALALSVVDESFLAILRIAQDRLSILVSSKPVLHDRAENILIKAWRLEIKKHGYSHDCAIASLKKVLEFWASAMKIEYKQKAKDILQEAVLGVIVKEVNPHKLYLLAEHFYSMYRLFGFSYSELEYLSTIRIQIFRSESRGRKEVSCGGVFVSTEFVNPKPEILCGEVYLENKRKETEKDILCGQDYLDKKSKEVKPDITCGQAYLDKKSKKTEEDILCGEAYLEKKRKEAEGDIPDKKRKEPGQGALCGQPYLEGKPKRGQVDDDDLFGQGSVSKKHVVVGSFDRRSLVLVYSLEGLFRSKKQGDLFSDSLTRVLAEASLYEAWLRASAKDDRLDDLITTGTRLIEHLDSFNLHSESRGVHDELWLLFSRSLGKNDTKVSSTYHLFKSILTTVHSGFSVSILESALAVVQELSDASNYLACFRLSEWIYSYGHTTTDLDDSSSALLFLKLSTLLYTCSEAETASGISLWIKELATNIGVFAMRFTSDIDLSVMSISHLKLILSIAGKQKDYKTLKQILELLWTSRNSYDFNLTPTTTVSIGKRLAEVYFACGEHTSAFSLLEDITYNLKDVYGAHHSMVLECQRLLASMHEKLGHRKSAIDVRMNLLRDAVCGFDEDSFTHAHEGTHLDESIAFYIEQLQSLRSGYAAAEDDYSWHLEQNMDSLEEIMDRVKKLMGRTKTHRDTGDVLDICGWKELEVDVKEDQFDVWNEPEDWRVEMEMEEESDEGAWSVTDVEEHFTL